MIKFKVFRSKKNRQFYFHILSRNGRKIAQSEGYKRVEGVYKVLKALTATSNWTLQEVQDASGDWVLV